MKTTAKKYAALIVTGAITAGFAFSVFAAGTGDVNGDGILGVADAAASAQTVSSALKSARKRIRPVRSRSISAV